tara:strand:- start:610 stop:1584 length:975 start_codon:yes stop_codon:yes gene_type:complete
MFLILGSVGASDLDIFIQTLSKALALGSLYSLLALGFVLIYKTTQTLNFSQGALALTGTWFMSMIFIDWDFPGRFIGGPSWLHWFMALVVAVLVTSVLGIAIERLTIRPLVGQSLFSMAMITLALEVILRTVSFDAVSITTRLLNIPWGSQIFTLGGARIPWSYFAAFLAAIIAFVGVWMFFKTRLGVSMRATSFDQEAAMAQGINVHQAFSIAWAAGAGFAAIAGIFASMPPWPAAGAASPEGAFFVFRALPAVILGGLDSVVGALVGGLIIGLVEIFAGQYLSSYSGVLGVGYQVVVPYLVMLIGLLTRPYGLFGTKEIRRV